MIHYHRILFLLIFLFMQSACSKKPKPKIQEDHISNPKKVEKPISTPSKNAIQPEPEKETTPTKSTKKEMQPSISATQYQVLRDSQIYSFRVDQYSNQYEEMIEPYTKLDCEDIPISSKLVFDRKFRENFREASVKTHLYDGKLFCLKDLNLSEDTIGKLLFGRSEGGHKSDGISIVTANPKTKSIYHLEVSSHYGREGFDKTIASKLDGQTVFRKIEIRYGDSNTHPDSLALQPRRVIHQAFNIYVSGVMDKVYERIEKFNIDE